MEPTQKELAMLRAFRAIGEPVDNIILWYTAGRRCMQAEMLKIAPDRVKEDEYEISVLKGVYSHQLESK
jgi:hypothetical protein